MAEVVAFPGQSVPVPPEAVAPIDFPTHLRGLAELIETGQITTRGIVVALAGDNQVVVQRLGLTPLEAVGLVVLAQKTIVGGG